MRLVTKLLMVAGFIILGFSIYTTMVAHSRWIGSYQAGECIDRSDEGMPGMCWTYNINVTRKWLHFAVDVNVDGFQTMTSLNAYAFPYSSSKLKIFNKSTKEGDSSGRFKLGDHLLTLKYKADKPAYAIKFKEMESNKGTKEIEVDKKSTGTFKKVLK